MKFIFGILLMIFTLLTGTVCRADAPGDAHSSLILTADSNKTMLKNAPVNATMEIYNIVGAKVKSYKITDSNQIFLVKLSEGYYLVKIEDVVRKIAIK